MIALGLWILSTTVAHADTFAGLSGVFVPTTSYEQIMAERNASVERSLEASNFIVRTVAASASLETQPTMCSKYKFAYDNSTLFVQCDDHPNIPVYLDGRPTQYPKKDGTYIDVIAKVRTTPSHRCFRSQMVHSRSSINMSRGSSGFKSMKVPISDYPL